MVGGEGSCGVVVWWDADVLVPELGILLDELTHDGGAAWIIEDAELDGVGSEEVFSAHEGAVLSNDDARNAVEEESTRAHDAGAEGGCDCEGVPVPTSACGSDACDLGVGGGVAGLDTEIVGGGDDAEVG